MSRYLSSLLFAPLLLTGGTTSHAQAESKVSCDTVPIAVLTLAKSEAPGAAIRGCVRDKEQGKVVYEVETLKDSKSKDMTFTAEGTLLEVEQQVDRASLPEAVASAMRKAANGGQIGKIESVARGGTIASYETTVMREGKRREVAFRPDGNPMKAD